MRRFSDPGPSGLAGTRDVPRALLQGIAQHDLFAHVPPHVLADLASRMHTMRHRRGDALVREGDTGAALFLVVSGSVHVRVWAADDAPIATIGRGGFFGEIGAFYGLPRTATVTVASGDATIASLPRKDAYAVLAEHPAVLASVLAVAQQRYYATMRRGVSNRSLHPRADVLLRAGSAGGALQSVDAGRQSTYEDSAACGGAVRTPGCAGSVEVVRRVFPRLFRNVGDGALHAIASGGAVHSGAHEIVAFAHEPVVVLVLEGALGLRLNCEDEPVRDFAVGGVASIARHHPVTAFLAASKDGAAVLKMPLSAFSRLESDATAIDRGQALEHHVPSQDADPSAASLARGAPGAALPHAARNVVAWTAPEADAASPEMHVTGPRLPARSLYAEGDCSRCEAPLLEVPIFVEAEETPRVSHRHLFPEEGTLRPAQGVRATLTASALLTGLDEALVRGERIRCIDMQDCVRLGEDAFVGMVARLGRKTGSVTSLCLAGCPGVTDRVLEEVCTQMPFVEHLEISHCRNLTAASLASVARLTDVLVTLRLRRLVAVTDSAVEDMLVASDAGAAWPARLFSRLAALDLSECAFLTTRGLGAMLSRAPRLRTLRVAMCDGLNERLARALARLPAPQRLTFLDISHCSRVLADRPLASVLAAVPNVQRLEIRGGRRLTPALDGTLSQIPSVVGRSPLGAPQLSPVLQVVSVAP